MTSFFLNILGLLRPIIQQLGADYDQVRAIVSLKLTLDNRRSYTAFRMQQQNQQKEHSNSFWIMLGLYALFMGGFTALFLGAFAKQVPLFAFSMGFGIPMTLTAMTLITDFSSVILDSSDNAIILPRPVSARTLLVARLVHIIIYLTLITLSVSLISIIVTIFVFNALAALAFFTFQLLGTLLVVFLTNLLYMVLMRLTSEERLREILNYFQIVAAIVFYASYQVLPRMINFADDTLRMDVQWWHYLIPPVWLAGSMEMVLFGTFDLPHYAFLALSLVMPFAGLWIINRYLAPIYNQRLATIDTDHRKEPVAAARQSASRMPALVRLLARTPLEQAGFMLTWRIMLRDRKFKLKVYPAIGYLVVIVLFSMWRINFQDTTSGSRIFLMALYFSNFIGISVLPYLWYSDQSNASWVYLSTPLNRPGEVIMGSLKAVILQFVLPAFLIASIVVGWFFGPSTLDDIMLVGFINFISLLLIALTTQARLPFSLPSNAMTNGLQTGRNLLAMVVIGLMGFVHFGLTYIPYGPLIALPFAALTAYYLVKKIQETSWDSIQS